VERAVLLEVAGNSSVAGPYRSPPEGKLEGSAAEMVGPDDEVGGVDEAALRVRPKK
jgi:hypothetical protein